MGFGAGEENPVDVVVDEEGTPPPVVEEEAIEAVEVDAAVEVRSLAVEARDEAVVAMEDAVVAMEEAEVAIEEAEVARFAAVVISTFVDVVEVEDAKSFEDTISDMVEIPSTANNIAPR